MIFVDSSAWYACFAAKDKNFAAANAFLSGNSISLVTTDYVADETLTLFKARGNYAMAFQVGRRLVAGNLAMLIHINDEDFANAWRLFESHRDKAWSFTDCTSYVVMQRLSISQAFAFDEHFGQFGFVSMQP